MGVQMCMESQGLYGRDAEAAQDRMLMQRWMDGRRWKRCSGNLVMRRDVELQGVKDRQTDIRKQSDRHMCRHSRR